MREGECLQIEWQVLPLGFYLSQSKVLYLL